MRKLYYEKIRKEQEAVTAEAKKEETKKPNKISINPDLKEYKGYDLAKKFFIKMISIKLIESNKLYERNRVQLSR